MPTDYQNILTDLVKRVRPLLAGISEGTYTTKRNAAIFPMFVPIQAAQQINGGTTDVPLSIMTSAIGPAVGEIGVGGGSNDVYMAGGFYVPDDYGGGTHNISLVFRIPDSGGTGTVDIDTNAMRMPFTASYWTTSTPDTNSYVDVSLSGYSTSRMYYAYDANLTLQAKDFVSIWSAYYASTSTFDREVRFAGWYIV